MGFPIERSGELTAAILPLLGRVAIALFCGALIGLERGRSGKPAGLRTNILICVGAALYAIASELSAKLVAKTPAEAGRITAQVVTGVGFIGAGAILRSGLAITGLTTAATIWLVAAIGVLIGLGFPMLGVAATVVTLLTLVLFAEVQLGGRCEFRDLSVTVPPGRPLKAALCEAIVRGAGGPTRVQAVRQTPEGTKIEFRYCQRHPEHSAFLDELDRAL